MIKLSRRISGREALAAEETGVYITFQDYHQVDLIRDFDCLSQTTELTLQLASKLLNDLRVDIVRGKCSKRVCSRAYITKCPVELDI